MTWWSLSLSAPKRPPVKWAAGGHQEQDHCVAVGIKVPPGALATLHPSCPRSAVLGKLLIPALKGPPVRRRAGAAQAALSVPLSGPHDLSPLA